MNRRILFIIPSLNAGGAERVAINYLRQIDNNKYSVSLVVFNKTDDLIDFLPKHIQLIDLKTLSTSGSFWSLLLLLRKLRPDVIFTTHSRVASLLIFIKPFVPKFKHLARMQNTPSLEKKYKAYSGLRRIIYAYGFRSANLVIAQTEAMKKDGVSLFGLNVEKIKVLPNPVDNAHIDKCVQNSSSPFPEGQISAVAAGRLAFAKGFDVLISALPKVLEVYPNFVLYILGKDDGHGNQLRSLVAELGLEKSVKFTGFQSNPYRYYAHSDLFILSSRWEGFPNVLLENYYLNKPIVSTRCVPIIEDLIKESVNGSLCHPGDKESLQIAICKVISRSSPCVYNGTYVGGRLDDII